MTTPRTATLSSTAIATCLWLTAAATVMPRVGATQDDGLPDGPGKTILQASCTSCHDLDEVTKFKGFYTRAQWRDVVVTMVDYGAKVRESDVDVLADYLAEHLGKK